MAKEMRHKQNWGEVAPTLLVPVQKSTRLPKLETIVEEGYEDMQVAPNGALFLVSLFVSVVSYCIFLIQSCHMT